MGFNFWETILGGDGTELKFYCVIFEFLAVAARFAGNKVMVRIKLCFRLQNSLSSNTVLVHNVELPKQVERSVDAYGVETLLICGVKKITHRNRAECYEQIK